MESSLPSITHTESELTIGMLSDTPTLYFIPLEDFNRRRINVPCSNLNMTVQQFLEEYKANSNCQYLFKQVPSLIINQGKMSGQVALPSETLMSFEFNFNEICFKVKDIDRSDFEELVKKSELEKKKEKSQEIQVKILFENKFYLLRIKTTDTLLNLKKAAISEIPPLKQKSPDLLQVQYKGFFIIDDKVLLSKHQIIEGSVILMLIKKKSGCFHKNTKIMMANGSEITIDNIKKGDKILSFNEKQKKLQIDTVTYIQNALIKEALEIQLQGNRIIHSTPNHRFLCDDGIYRCFTKERQQSSLEQRSCLSLWNGQTAKIISIFNREVQIQSQQFYHLSVQNNHNFIANGLIAHNMFIKIKFETNIIQEFNVTPHDQIIGIKKRIQELYYIDVHSQKLYYFGKELFNNKTIADYNIPKQSTLHFRYSNAEINLIKQNTPILMADGTSVEVQRLKKGSKIATYDCLKNIKSSSGNIVYAIDEIKCKNFMKISLGSFEKNDELIVTSDSFIQCENGQIFCVWDLCYDFEPESRPRIKIVDSKPMEIKGIYHLCEQKEEIFYKVSTNAFNFIAKGIIMHDFVANIIFFKQSKRLQKITIGSQPQETLKSIKNKLEIMKIIDANILFNIDVDKSRYIFDEKVLEDNNSLQTYEIDSSKIIEAIVDESEPSILKSSNIIFVSPTIEMNIENKIYEKDILLRVSTTEEYRIQYLQSRFKRMEDILKEILPRFDYGSYFFIFSSTLMFPSDYLNKIEESPQFFKTNEISILMVKNQKVAFLHALNLGKQDFKTHAILLKTESQILPSRIVSSLSKQYLSKNAEFMSMKRLWLSTQRIANDLSIVHQNFKLQIFYNPFLFLTSRKYTFKINQYIHNFYQYKHEYSDPLSLFTVITDLYLNMQLLPFYYDRCYLGVKNFRFSRYFKEKNTFYLHGFTITFKKNEKIKSELIGQSGSFFIIRSLTGKEINKYSLYPEEQQVLFAPFTCFLIQKIIHREEYDQIYLVQLSSPISFLKDIILWVDDEPKNNIRDIIKIYKQIDVQILQATSTTEALKWISEFGWLMNWKGLEFKLISDMSRWELTQSEMNLNKRAGIDLLIELYNNLGVTAQTLIYCGDEKKARGMARQAKIPKDRYDITISLATLKNFCQTRSK